MESQSVFLSYRRDDSAGHTGRLHDRLIQRWGSDRLFWDIENIPPGEDFVDAIDRTLDNCAIVLVVIGPRWLTGTDESGARRIDDESDFHRLEIERAIERKIPLLPVLVGGARMPKPAELPTAIRSLARRNAFELTDKRFNYDASNLADAIDRLLASLTAEAIKSEEPSALASPATGLTPIPAANSDIHQPAKHTAPPPSTDESEQGTTYGNSAPPPTKRPAQLGTERPSDLIRGNHSTSDRGDSREAAVGSGPPSVSQQPSNRRSQSRVGLGNVFVAVAVAAAVTFVVAYAFRTPKAPQSIATDAPVISSDGFRTPKATQGIATDAPTASSSDTAPSNPASIASTEQLSDLPRIPAPVPASPAKPDAKLAVAIDVPGAKGRTETALGVIDLSGTYVLAEAKHQHPDGSPLFTIAKGKLVIERESATRFRAYEAKTLKGHSTVDYSSIYEWASSGFVWLNPRTGRRIGGLEVLGLRDGALVRRIRGGNYVEETVWRRTADGGPTDKWLERALARAREK